MTDPKIEGIEYAITLVDTYLAGLRASGRAQVSVRIETAAEVKACLKGAIETHRLLPVPQSSEEP